MNPSRPFLALALLAALAGCGRAPGPDATPPASGGGASPPAAAASPASGGDSMEGMTSASPMGDAGHEMDAASPGAAAYTSKLTVEPDPPQPGQPAGVAFAVIGAEGPVTKYDVVHEKQAHLILISRDLSEFQHLHPDMDPDGTWRGSVTFPKPGPYRFYLDVTPTGASQQVLRSDITVAGEASPATVEVDASPKTVEGVRIELSSDPAELKQGDAMLTFRLSRDGKPVSDLEPYLGAMGHLVIVDEAGEQFLHAHPMNESTESSPHTHAPGEGHAPERGGPEVTFHTSFPAPGVYKMWGQFQRGGRILTAPFVVRVQ